MHDENAFTTEHRIAVIRTDSYDQAKRIETRLAEVIQCLEDDNHLGALGSFAELDADVLWLKVFLTHIAHGRDPLRSPSTRTALYQPRCEGRMCPTQPEPTIRRKRMCRITKS